MFNEENRCLFRREEGITYKFIFFLDLNFLSGDVLGFQFSFGRCFPVVKELNLMS